MIQIQPLTLYLSISCANPSIGIAAALNPADPGRLATEDLNFVNNASPGRPGWSYRRNTGKMIRALARYCSDEEYDSTRMTVANK
jgi:hypothetical protein